MHSCCNQALCSSPIVSEHFLCNYFHGHFQKKLLATSLDDNQAFFSRSDIVPVNYSSLMGYQICGPSNTPLLIFSIGSPLNCKMMYLKQSPSVDNAFTNCFMRHSFMHRGENIIFFLSTSGSCRMLASPGLRPDLGGQFVTSQCFSRALLSHIQSYFAALLKSYFDMGLLL